MTPTSWLIRDAESGEVLAGAGDPDRAFMWGSVSKLCTSTMLDLTVEHGVLDVRNSVQLLCPELPCDQITLELLALHRSGLRRLPKGIHWWSRDPYRPWTVDVMIRGLPHEPCGNAGSKYRYSNLGYALLGYCISQALNKPWSDACQQLVLVPAGAHRVTIATGDDDEWDLSGAIAPAGGLCGSMTDLSRVISWMRRRVDATGPTRAWQWRDGVWFHNGATRRTRTFVAIRPDSPKVLVAVWEGRRRWQLDGWGMSLAQSI